MTQTFVVFATFISAWLYVASGSNNSGPAKLLVLALMFGSMSFHLIGLAITAPRRLALAAREVLSDFWPIILLALFIMSGSGFARFGQDIAETFIGFGIGMMFLPMMAMSVRAARDPVAMMKSLGVVYVGMVVMMLALLAMRRSIYHEEIFVAVPLCAYFLCAYPLKIRQVAIGFGLIALCLLSVKNTTFLLVLTTLAVCTILWVTRATRTREKLVAFSMLYFGALIMLCVAGGLVAAWWYFRDHLPSGNTEYRREMYGIAWRRFLSSPLWGTGFTDSTVNYFDLYKIDTPMQTLPTHSDVIDMLGHGGLIAVGLWLTVVWKIFFIFRDALLAVARANDVSSPQPWRWLLVLSLVNIGGVLTYGFNPVLHRPVQGVWIWGTLGVSWALHRMLTTSPRDNVPQAMSMRKAFA